ncbi:class I SAM-dependent methyltransferase [Psychroserpens sp.]|uniref:class I SAM-dependent methyltransferase n=1 Tax=Psychroserpens sp. TaxID=2020870 RepID=UPI0030013FD9
MSRIRLLLFSLNYFDLESQDRKILHIAPNINEFNYFRKHVTKMSNYDRLNIKKFDHINLNQDLTKTNIKSDTYDLVIAWHVFEHIPNDTKAINEVYRLLKPNGNALVSVPIFPENNIKTLEDESIDYKDYEKIHGHYDHCRSCGFDYYERFESSGFSTKTLLANKLKTTDLDKFGLKKDHVVWNFTK